MSSSFTDQRLMRSGNLPILIKKDIMVLLQSFQNILKRAKRSSQMPHTKKYGGQTLMEQVKTLMKHWPNLVLLRVNCY